MNHNDNIEVMEEKTPMDYSTFQKKQLLNLRLQTIFMGATLGIILLGVLFMAGTARTITKTVEDLQQAVNALDMESVNDAISTLTTTAENVNTIDMTVLNGTISSLEEAAGTLSSFDMTTFNETIAALEGAADNLGNLDTTSLNTLITSLSETATTLQNAVDSIKNFSLFGSR